MLPSKREVMDFTDAISDRGLPVYLQITSECTMNNKTVLEKDQRLTVLDRGKIDLLSGHDWNGKTFRVAKEMVQNYHVDIVEEFYPANLDELHSIAERCNYIQTKREYKVKEYHFAGFEMFQFTKFLDKEHKITAMVNSTGEYYVDSEILLNSNYFVFVKINDAKKIRDFIRSFNPEVPNLVCFRDEHSGLTLPKGNVKIETIANYEIAYTVTAINKDRELKYETFPVDKRIQVRRCGGARIPSHVQVFGDYNTEKYRTKLDEIKVLMNYDCHAPRFYAYLIIENQLYVPELIRKQQQVTIDGFGNPTFSRSNKNPSSVRESIRRFFKQPVKKSPSKPQSQIAYDKTEGVYRSKEENLSTLSSNVETPKSKAEKKKSNEAPKHPIRSKSDSKQATTLSSQDNPIYGVDTLFTQQIKNYKKQTTPVSIQSKNLPGDEVEKRRKEKPRRPKSFDFDSSITEEAFETPFNELSPTGNVQHISDSQINTRWKTSRMFQEKKPARPLPLRPYIQSRSVSPPSGNAIFDLDMGGDSGVDSPEDIKNYGQLMRSFEERNNEYRDRSQSAREGSSYDQFDISRPFNVKQLTQDETTVTSPVYDIPPSRKTSALARKFDELDSSNEFPEIEKFEIWRSRSEPFLNRNLPRYQKFPVYEEIVGNFGEIYSSGEINYRQKQELKSLSMIKSLTITEVSQILMTLKLDRHIPKFAANLISGSLLLNLSEIDFQKDLQMTPFESRKLYKYIHGWRPKMINREINSATNSTTVEQMDRDEWTISDVESQLKMINLPDFATFCVNNLVDGVLLLHLVHEQMIPTMELDGIKLTRIEIERLRMYMMKEISYKEQDRIFMGQMI